MPLLTNPSDSARGFRLRVSASVSVAVECARPHFGEPMPHLPDLPRMALAASSQLPVVVSSHLRNRGCRIRQLPRTAQPLHRPRETEATHPGRHPQAALQPNRIVACTPQRHCSRAVVGKRTCCGCSENCATSESSVACKSTANGTARWSGVIVSVGSFERVRGHRPSNIPPPARTNSAWISSAIWRRQAIERPLQSASLRLRQARETKKRGRLVRGRTRPTVARFGLQLVGCTWHAARGPL